MSTAGLALLVIANIVCIAGLSILIGITAPRWPDRWFRESHGPLTWQVPGETAAFARANRGRWNQRLPELGSMFGGVSKRNLPGHDLASLRDYTTQVRRAEWVHLLSVLTFLPMVWINPWWLTVVFAAVAVLINLPFLVVLRHNRTRLERLIARRSAES